MTSGSSAAPAPPSAGPDAAGVTWLCRPGLPGDPCLFPEGATSVAANGAKTVVPAPAASQPDFDCFYVYPTVTASAATANTGTAVTLAVEAAAVAQASRFSQVCSVWAPTYRQRTARHSTRVWATIRRRTGSPTRACWPGGRTTWPTTTTAVRSSSSGTPRGRPTSSSCCVPRSTTMPRCAAGWSRRSSWGATSRSRGQDGGRDLHPHPGLHRHGPDPLRHRLLVVLLHAPGRLALRSARVRVSACNRPSGHARASRCSARTPPPSGRPVRRP